MRELEYPFDSELILKKAKKIKRLLQKEGGSFLNKKIAVLGGSTTHDIVRILDLFLLQEGIRGEFYQSEYNQYWQDAVFDNPGLQAFAPDLIVIHTSSRNISAYPALSDKAEAVEELLEQQYHRFEIMWERLEAAYHCPVIQNNFEYPVYRLMGNAEAWDIHGRVLFISRLNLMFAEYARKHENFYIHDINYLSAVYGLDKWADPSYWYMYKYACSMQAIPTLAANLTHIVKALFGKNKKSLVLDLDNTLWGGVVGDDGPEGLELGPETPIGQAYSEFQEYIKAHQELGVMLNINSKNEYDNAVAGLNHPDGVLKPEDFVLIKANWEPKDRNISAIAAELDILPDSLVFIDDNPAEREIVRRQAAGTAVPEITRPGQDASCPEHYARIIDRNGYFEVLRLSQDDRNRTQMYQSNAVRRQQESRFTDYTEYLHSLEMHAVIRPFEPLYMPRIAQLTNKSNQFNLTTRRLTQSEIEAMAASEDYLTFYGKLVDKFGDNGVVSVVIGRKESATLHIELWLMSCRVLKRDMEYAMMDQVIAQCRKQHIDMIRGYYYPTAKNAMVRDFYGLQGFEKVSQDEAGNSIWQFPILPSYQNKNDVIKVNG